MRECNMKSNNVRSGNARGGHTRRTAARIALCLLMVLSLCINTGAYAQAASKKSISTKTLNKGYQFTFNNMPYNGQNSPIREYKGKTLSLHTVQNFAYSPDNKYIFTTAECNSGGSDHTLLCRTTNPSSTGKNSVAEFQQAHVLYKFGHGESIDVTQPNKKSELYYIWVSCTANKDGYGTEIARLTYKVDSKGNGHITSTVKLKNFNKANVKNGSATKFSDADGQRKVYRTAVAIDEKTNQIMFRLKFQDGAGTNYVSYNYKKLNSALNKLSNGKKYDIAKAAKWQRANVKSYAIPYDTYQSFYVCGKNIYVCGGNAGKGASVYVVSYSLQKEGKTSEQDKPWAVSKEIKLSTSLKIKGKSYGKSAVEVEGIKVKKSGSKTYLYVTFRPNGASIRDSIPVYKVRIK